MPKRKKQPVLEEEGPKKTTLYTIKLTDEQMVMVKEWCEKRLWEYYEVDYAHFGYKGDKINLVGYKSGKLVVQGKKTEDWVTFVLEAEITMTPELGYDEVNNPEWFTDHAGLDESGKGDLFGPLVSCCVVATGDMVTEWREAGIMDSKRITSDRAILKLDKIIVETKGVVVKRMALKMPKYNELYGKFGSNLNRLLAWQHAKCLESALAEKKVSWGLLDQFSKQPLVQCALTKDSFAATDFDLQMRTKAESDPVVAAASICARAEFVRRMADLSKIAGIPLAKGASATVKSQAKELVKKFGDDRLGEFAKLHFRTAFEARGLPVPEKKAWKK
ncbi:ribonuclease HIII [Cerasicoccus arenae]|uniref:Ribonuclease n=1 Tax=Cerasicoccus arenae TaxID=424488 RepID=A0A8J3DBK7_9BACT|nr:ribonuclease HIII [Cerasicoccus arenae]MBK1856773.1 ribonuclease HIII [Cerasicoccus arenae]GHB99412.1 ribonuclease HIII [Cerasicoccus arenae]